MSNNIVVTIPPGGVGHSLKKVVNISGGMAQMQVVDFKKPERAPSLPSSGFPQYPTMTSLCQRLSHKMQYIKRKSAPLRQGNDEERHQNVYMMDRDISYIQRRCLPSGNHPTKKRSSKRKKKGSKKK